MSSVHNTIDKLAQQWENGLTRKNLEDINTAKTEVTEDTSEK